MTLRANILGNRIEWLEASEGVFPPERHVEALITPLGERESGVSARERAERRVAALKQLVAQNAFPALEDPSGWQREARGERSLPGRES